MTLFICPYCAECPESTNESGFRCCHLEPHYHYSTCNQICTFSDHKCVPLENIIFVVKEISIIEDEIHERLIQKDASFTFMNEGCFHVILEVHKFLKSDVNKALIAESALEQMCIVIKDEVSI